ncbi:MAG: type III-A CRISPR-associated protein Csm2 [Bacteroidales bacterium]|jgi:CRISPR type III-A-associated protein Csm2|nr:type III-A CRISPR-associated protein Csm2 [Bacteroidales bacterium]
MNYPTDKLKQEWIQTGITQDATAWAESFGKFLCGEQINKDNAFPRGALTTSQLRRFFGEVKRISTDFDRNQTDLVMLKHMLAYAVGRDIDNKTGKNKTRIKQFEEELSKGLGFIRSDNNKRLDFKNFVKLFEAIVAYHKYYVGK